MPYIGSDGTLIQKKPWTIKSIVEIFWSIIAFIVFFFRGLFQLDAPVTKGQFGQPKRDQGGPRRRMGGFGRGVSSPAPPPCGAGG